MSQVQKISPLPGSLLTTKDCWQDLEHWYRRWGKIKHYLFVVTKICRVLLTRFFVAIKDIFFDSFVKKNWFLLDETNLLTKPLNIQIFYLLGDFSTKNDYLRRPAARTGIRMGSA